MSEIDDAKEWAETANDGNFDGSEYQPNLLEKRSIEAQQPILIGDQGEEQKPVPGQPTQYSLYADGYTATTPTINTLPPGCYDVRADNRCVYVTPALKPTGILLELPEMRSEDVIKTVETFWNSEKDYKEGNEFVIGGATFKAGIMIFGPGGSGKSSIIKIISRKLVERGGTVFYASGSPSSTMSFLMDFTKIEKNRKSIVVLEDIDSLIHRFGDSEYLEMLDSAKSIDNVLFIATTNYPERLEPRIYNRPGRFSHVIKVGYPTAKAREAYLKAILKDHRDVDYIVENTKGFTIDHLTSLVNARYREKKDLESEIERLRTLFKVPKTEEKPLGIGVERSENE